MNSLTGTNRLVLKIQGLQHVPAMKNNKMIARGRLITNPKRQEWMENAIHSIESQLCSMCQTTGDETQMGHLARSLIAHAEHWDDSVSWVPEIHVYVQRVKKGEEGATITIEEIQP